jgi:GTPase SAR1 family protein
MVKIIHLEKPNLGITKMNCDGVIAEKLNKYPVIKDCFSTSSFNIVIGRMGSGKSSLLVSLLKRVFNKCFHSIYIFMPANSRASLEDDIFAKHIPHNQLFDTLTQENLQEVYERVQKDSADGYFSLIVIDDFQVALKDKKILHVLNAIITKQRHLRTSTFLLQQNWQACNKSLRELASNIITFNLGKSQMEKVFNEVIQIDKDKYQSIIDTCFKSPHDYLIFNLNRSRNIYCNMDLLDLS